MGVLAKIGWRIGTRKTSVTRRCLFWENRLIEIAKDAPDHSVRNAAELAVRHMQDIKDASEKL